MSIVHCNDQEQEQVKESLVLANPFLIQAIGALPIPTSISMVKSYLGLFCYHRHLIPRYHQIALPLLPLLQHARANDGETFLWGHEQQQAFHQLQQSLYPSLIHHPL